MSPLKEPESSNFCLLWGVWPPQLFQFAHAHGTILPKARIPFVHELLFYEHVLLIQ